MGIVWELNTVMCKKYLAQGLTFHIWSTSCVHEEEVNDEEDDDDNEDDGDNDADDDQHLSHNGEKAHCWKWPCHIPQVLL